MLDTNDLIQAGQIAQTAREQISPWLPAITIAAAWLGRELNRLSAWLQTATSKIIAHGGLIKIVIKLFWAPDIAPLPACPAPAGAGEAGRRPGEGIGGNSESAGRGQG